MNECQHVTSYGLRNGGKHTDLAVEALTVLELIDAVVKNMKGS